MRNRSTEPLLRSQAVHISLALSAQSWKPEAGIFAFGADSFLSVALTSDYSGSLIATLVYLPQMSIFCPGCPIQVCPFLLQFTTDPIACDIPSRISPSMTVNTSFRPSQFRSSSTPLEHEGLERTQFQANFT